MNTNKLFIKTLTVILTICSIKGFAQTNFDKGFKNGYSKGFCYGKSLGCILPIIPVTPMPNIGEEISSFQDGYNRGFILGIELQKKEPSNASSKFETTNPKDIDFMYRLNMNDIAELSKVMWQLKDLAFKSYEAKDYATCIYLVSKGLSVSPKDSEFYTLGGMAYYGQKEYKLALETLSIAKQYSPGDTKIDEIINHIKKEFQDSKH